MGQLRGWILLLHEVLTLRRHASDTRLCLQNLVPDWQHDLRLAWSWVHQLCTPDHRNCWLLASIIDEYCLHYKHQLRQWFRVQRLADWLAIFGRNMEIHPKVGARWRGRFHWPHRERQNPPMRVRRCYRRQRLDQVPNHPCWRSLDRCLSSSGPWSCNASDILIWC